MHIGLLQEEKRDVVGAEDMFKRALQSDPDHSHVLCSYGLLRLVNHHDTDGAEALYRRKCCSVLQCVAVCCSVLQCVAVCCSVLQCVAVYCSVLPCVAVCCRVLKSVAVKHHDTDGAEALNRRKCDSVFLKMCCSVFQCAVVFCSVL